MAMPPTTAAPAIAAALSWVAVWAAAAVDTPEADDAAALSPSSSSFSMSAAAAEPPRGPLARALAGAALQSEQRHAFSVRRRSKRALDSSSETWKNSSAEPALKWCAIAMSQSSFASVIVLNSPRSTGRVGFASHTRDEKRPFAQQVMTAAPGCGDIFFVPLGRIWGEEGGGGGEEGFEERHAAALVRRALPTERGAPRPM